MNQLEIEVKFNEVLHKYGALSKIPWITKNMTYQWRHNITQPSIGDKIGVLYELGLIKIEMK
jgi:hypothetical protein